MEPVAMIREALADAHGSLERTVADLDAAALEWMPPGTANPIGATFAHVLVSEDMVVNAILADRAPLLRGAFATATGLSEPMPMPGPEWADYAAWARRLRVDPPALLAYARATWETTDAFVGGLSATDLDREVDLVFLGRGRRTLGWALQTMILAHANQITGEIACLKGLQGRGGYA